MLETFVQHQLTPGFPFSLDGKRLLFKPVPVFPPLDPGCYTIGNGPCYKRTQRRLNTERI